MRAGQAADFLEDSVGGGKHENVGALMVQCYLVWMFVERPRILDQGFCEFGLVSDRKVFDLAERHNIL